MNSPFLRVGDRVMLSSRFCRLLCASGGSMAALKGTVLERWSYGRDQMVAVLWDDEGTSRAILAHNLIRVSHDEPVDAL